MLSALATPVAKAEDSRTAVDLPPDVRTQFLEHMRTHMNALNDVVQLMAQGKIREAGSTARKEMAIGQGQGFGRYMPPEFREMGSSITKRPMILPGSRPRSRSRQMRPDGQSW